MARKEVVYSREGVPDFVIFGDNQLAELIKIREGKTKEGIPTWEMILVPDDDCKQKHNIYDEDLDDSGYYIGKYKQHEVIFNPTDPRNRYTNVLVDIKGNPTELSKLFSRLTETIDNLYIKNQSYKLAYYSTIRQIKTMAANPLEFQKQWAKQMMEKNKGVVGIDTTKESDTEN